MRRYLLDTNIVSDLIRPTRSAPMVAWMAERSREALFIATLTLGELHRGVLQTPPGARQRALQAWFDGADGPPTLFAGRILPFDERAALVWGGLMADAKRAGRPRSTADTIIAATALAHDCTVVTANEKDFWGIAILNPLRA